MRKIQTLFLVSILGLLVSFVGCTPDELEFARPTELEGPVYQQLEALGQFNHYVACLDRTEYAEPLKTGGSWTAFVPTDEAFEEYLAENNYASVNDIPLQRVKDIVRYSLIIDAYNTTTLTFYPSGWYAGNSFRRYTLYQDSMAIVKGSDYPNFEDVEDRDYLVDRSLNRRKTTNYWVDQYIDSDKQRVERSDYTYMFPGEKELEKGEMRIFDAEVTEQEIIAENGMIYALNKVLEPKPHLYANLSGEEYEDKYSIFKSLIDRFGYFRYIGLDDNPYTGTRDSLFFMQFYTGITSNKLAYNPADEIMPKLLNNVDRTEANAVGLTVPTNQALLEYLQGDNELAKNYSSYDELPIDVVGLFLNVNFFTYYWDICPSHFGQSFNVGLEEIPLAANDVVETKFCSNGLFVGINKVFTTKSFSTVYGPLVLDTTYSVMLNAVKDLGLDNALQGTGIKYSILGLRNDQFVNIPDPNNVTRKITVIGHSPDMSIIYAEITGDPNPENNRIYPDPTISNPSRIEIDYVKETLSDIVLNQIIEQELDKDNYYQTKSGEFVYFSEGTQLEGGGDIYFKETANILEGTELANGMFYKTDKFINRPNKYTYGALLDNYTSFLQFLWVIDGAGARLGIPGYIYDFLISFIDLRKTYTLLAPNNAAIAQAIADGVIPNPNPGSLNGLSELDRAIATEKLLAFAKKHIIQHPIPTDGKVSGTFKSLYQTGIVDLIPQFASYTIDNDYENQKLTIYKSGADPEVLATTGTIVNLLTKRVVIHEIDSYLK